MIKKAVLISLLLFSGWTFILLKKPQISVTQNVWQENVSLAEHYIYDVKDVPNVIVGSSLSARIIMDSLPEFYNLSLGGQCIYDGLEIVSNRNEVPKRVFIEINGLEKELDETFKGVISHPLMRRLKASVPTFRADKQPLAFIGNYAKYFIATAHEKFVPPPGEGANVTSHDAPKESVFDKILAMKIAGRSKALDQELIDDRIAQLGSYIAELEARGVEIIFFETPIHADLQQLAMTEQIRDAARNNFSLKKYTYIPLPANIEAYQTTDGTHMTADDAAMFSHFFKLQVAPYID